MLALVLTLLSPVIWILEKLGTVLRKPRLRLLLDGSEESVWVLRVPVEETGTLLNHKRVSIGNRGVVAAQRVNLELAFSANLVREAAEMTDSFGFPEDEDKWKKYMRDSALVLEFTGNASIPPRGERELGNLRIPLRGGRVTSSEFSCEYMVSADNSAPKRGRLTLPVERGAMS